MYNYKLITYLEPKKRVRFRSPPHSPAENNMELVEHEHVNNIFEEPDNQWDPVMVSTDDQDGQSGEHTDYKDSDQGNSDDDDHDGGDDEEKPWLEDLFDRDGGERCAKLWSG